MSRSRSRKLLVVCAAVCALFGSTAAIASAEFPEYPEFRAEKYPISFGGTGTKTGLEERGGGSYGCTKVSVSGEISGPKWVRNVVLKFSGCSSSFCAQKAESAWQTNPMEGVISFVEPLDERAEIMLKATKQYEVDASCTRAAGQQHWAVLSGIVGLLSATGEGEFGLEYEQKEGVQALNWSSAWKQSMQWEMENPNHTASLLGMETSLRLKASGAVHLEV